MVTFKKTTLHSPSLTGVERLFGADELIVSKTDPKGIITYTNDVFLRVADYSEAEIIGKPHNLIRHPAMPHCTFKLVWDRIKSGKEIFAYVINRTKYGDHYWVFAHITPSFDANGTIIGYHSNRRLPSRSAIGVVEPLYRTLCSVESSHPLLRDGVTAATETLLKHLSDNHVSYDEFILSL